MIYPIPESLQDSHDGDEWAIGALLGGRVVALRYISDIAPHIALEAQPITEWLHSDPLELRELHALGPVGVGLVGTDGIALKWLQEPVKSSNLLR
ncbi:hypothetical protein [Bordetella genomosp. 4]|uniref:Uncharacterized protein n=1 Tax=Bordetella genomosp. 4 TaxID=463044 RepID=A0A261UTN7_9BORD|nr:hypothetical protein [Bordetella genomosp. 4]OZI64630.1 hypothetical protein CAL20_02975 [Bordetella genomosp. 4]